MLLICPDFTKKNSNSYALELVSPPNINDQKIRLQVVAHHTHFTDSVKISKEFILKPKVDKQLSTLGYTLIPMGVAELIFPFWNHYFWFYLAGPMAIYAMIDLFVTLINNEDGYYSGAEIISGKVSTKIEELCSHNKEEV